MIKAALALSEPMEQLPIAPYEFSSCIGVIAYRLKLFNYRNSWIQCISLNGAAVSNNNGGYIKYGEWIISILISLHSKTTASRSDELKRRLESGPLS